MKLSAYDSEMILFLPRSKYFLLKKEVRKKLKAYVEILFMCCLKQTCFLLYVKANRPKYLIPKFEWNRYEKSLIPLKIVSVTRIFLLWFFSVIFSVISSYWMASVIFTFINLKNVLSLSHRRLCEFWCGNHAFVENSHFFVPNISMKHTWGLKFHYMVIRKIWAFFWYQNLNFHEATWWWIIFWSGQKHSISKGFSTTICSPSNNWYEVYFNTTMKTVIYSGETWNKS